MLTSSVVAEEPYHRPTLSGWLYWHGDQVIYGQRTKADSEYLHAELNGTGHSALYIESKESAAGTLNGR